MDINYIAPVKVFQQDPRLGTSSLYNNAEIIPEIPTEQIIDSWLLERGKLLLPNNIFKIKTNPNLTISSAKRQLKYCSDLVQKLDEAQEDLKNNVEILSSTEWKQKTIDIGLLKDEFNQMIAKFEDPIAIKTLKNLLAKRQKKRRNEKNKKIAKRQEQAAKLEKRQKTHKKIDQWLESKKKEVEKAKMEEKLKKDADCILYEVTKKKSDARKQLSLISALVKLRSVRETMAIQRGEKTSLEDRQAFGSVTEKLIRMWEHVFQQYTQEEQNLKAKLEHNAFKDSKAAQIAKEQNILDEWRTVLFGQKDEQTLQNNIYWALTSAERDMETFIAIRKSWDTFLVDSNHKTGSCIPVGWVIPKQEVDERWKIYTKR